MIKVGITEFHGIALEYSKEPPHGIEYSHVDTNTKLTKRIFKSSAKGVYATVPDSDHDIIEAPLFPVITKKPWIYTPAAFSSAGAFDFFGIPTPRKIKMLWAENILCRDNLKKIIFKSNTGLNTLREYGGEKLYENLKHKSTVIYPAMRPVESDFIRFNENPTTLLFVGEFVRKGGINVVDAFLILKEKYPELKLRLCSNKNFNTWDVETTNKYKKIICSHPDIEMDLVERETLLTEILPNTDIYLCPTYQEAWGFSIQEAMAYGIPCIASNITAIPEMIEDNINGILIDIKNEDYIKKSKGYIIRKPDINFLDKTTSEIVAKVDFLIKDKSARKKIGLAAVQTINTKFSIAKRNNEIREIYNSAIE